MILRQQRAVVLVRPLEDALVVPERIVGIEANDQVVFRHA
jgi:hypothetical protein